MACLNAGDVEWIAADVFSCCCLFFACCTLFFACCWLVFRLVAALLRLVFWLVAALFLGLLLFFWLTLPLYVGALRPVNWPSYFSLYSSGHLVRYNGCVVAPLSQTFFGLCFSCGFIFRPADLKWPLGLVICPPTVK